LERGYRTVYRLYLLCVSRPRFEARTKGGAGRGGQTRPPPCCRISPHLDDARGSCALVLRASCEPGAEIQGQWEAHRTRAVGLWPEPTAAGPGSCSSGGAAPRAAWARGRPRKSWRATSVCFRARPVERQKRTVGRAGVASPCGGACRPLGATPLKTAAEPYCNFSFGGDPVARGRGVSAACPYEAAARHWAERRRRGTRCAWALEGKLAAPGRATGRWRIVGRSQPAASAACPGGLGYPGGRALRRAAQYAD